MSSDVVVLVVVLVVCLLVFRRINKPKVSARNQTEKPSTKVKYATRKAIENKQGAHSATASIPEKQTVKKEEIAEKAEAPASFLDFKLMTLAGMDSRLSAEIEHVLADFSKPHPLLMKLTSNNVDQKELSDLIKSDPDITAKILTVVNSAQYALQQPIKDISHAIIFLGVTHVKSIAMQFALHHSVSFEQPAQKKAYEKIWAASFLSSQLAMLLSKNLGRDNASELSTLSLLLYLGDLVLLTAKPEVAEQYLAKQSFFERLDNIQKLTDTNQAVVGYLLSQVWKLPASISDAMRHQLKPFVNKVKELELAEDEVKDLMVCYITCRLSDMVVFQGKDDVMSITELSYDISNNLEFYYLADNISPERLAQVSKELTANGFTHKAKELVARTLTQLNH